MKKDDVKVGKTYQAKVSGRLTEVRITGESRHGGWDALNVLTNKTVRIKTAGRLRGEALHGKKGRPSPATVKGVLAEAKAALAKGRAKAAETSEAAPDAPRKARKRADGKMSGLDAAVKVLEEAGAPMNTRAMCDAMHQKGYWSSEAPTPHNTLYSAILREIKTKGEEARFVKAERGKFALKR